MENIKKIHTSKFPTLSYRKLGEGPAIVLIHGFPESGNLWSGISPQLAEKFTVIIPDLPGSGDSTFTGTGVSVEDMAESINDILIDCGTDIAIIAGHSMGGYTALAFAEMYADKVKGLSLIHSFAGADSDEKKDIRRKSIDLMQKEKGREAFIRQMIPNLFSEMFQKEHPDVLEQQIENAMQLDVKSMVSFYNAMINRPERTKVLIDAGFPVQFVIGKEDNAVPIDVSAQQSTLSNRTFVHIYSDCGHMSMLEQPEKLTRDLKEFTDFCNKR